MLLETRGNAAIAQIPGTQHRFCEDRYRILTREIPLVANAERGEIYAVYDGIGGAPKGREAAQAMADCLVRFFQEPNIYPAHITGMEWLLMETNLAIHNWGQMSHRDTPLGGCAGTVAWIRDMKLHLLHAGDTFAILVRDGEPRMLTRTHQIGQCLSRYFGIGPYLKIDLGIFDLEDFDRLILASNGVSKAFDPVETTFIVEEHDDVRIAAGDLVRRARSRGSADDITALILQLEEE